MNDVDGKPILPRKLMVIKLYFVFSLIYACYSNQYCIYLIAFITKCD